MARQDKRQRLKELRRVMKLVERQGASHQPTPVEMAALVALVDTRLSTGRAAGRSGRAMALLGRMQDKSNDNAPGMDKIACKAGCYYCCDVYVSAQAPRIFAIADWLRETKPDLGAEIARLETADAAIRGKDVDARASAGLACPFLDKGKCGIYPVRPASCRGFFSLSAEACIAGARGDTEEIPTPAHIHPLRGAYEQALSAVLYHWRLPSEHYELTHGVLTALKDENAEARWYDGEDVFANVGIDRADDAMNPEMKQLESEFWHALWAVAHGEPADGPFADRFPDWCL
ncbi:MAG: YkgJ family cysteine cluster protein [Alphaproteobacteria bacterium]|nr:YkgJ family cysteine cluster protein [Alphaproteobacteria bacterium]